MTVTKGMLAAIGLLAIAASACTSKTGDPADPGTGGAGASGNGLQLLTIVPETGVATNITLTVYSDGWGTLLGTIPLATEGPQVIDMVEAQPYSNPAQYYIYAKADGFYTELYTCTKGASIDVDLDKVPVRSNAMAGVIFGQQSYFADSYLADTTVEIEGAAGSTTFTTDAQGRYGLDGLPVGTYALHFDYQGQTIDLTLVHDAEGTQYADLYFDEPMQAS